MVSTPTKSVKTAGVRLQLFCTMELFDGHAGGACLEGMLKGCGRQDKISLKQMRHIWTERECISPRLQLVSCSAGPYLHGSC